MDLISTIFRAVSGLGNAKPVGSVAVVRHHALPRPEFDDFRHGPANSEVQFCVWRR